MPARTAANGYETVGALGQARETQLESPQTTRATSYVKVVAKVALGTLGIGIVALAWYRHGVAAAPARAQQTWGFEEVSKEYQVKAFPQDCKGFMRYQGCEKKAWTCDADNDFSMGYKCCCDKDIWHTQSFQSGGTSSSSSSAATHSGVSVLRLQKSTNLCLAGPEDGGSHFRFAPCGDSNTRFKLPPRGAGIIELHETPGQCLAVATSSSGSLDASHLKHVKVANCNRGASEQMFQLTNGDKGMLQWSHGGNKCLDSENDSKEAGSKIMLADCVYWPMKPTQVFVLEDAPKPKAKDDDDDKKKKAVSHPSLFCTAIMLPWTYEVDMMRSMYERQCGIYECDAWAVVTNKKVALKKGDTEEDTVYADIMNGSLKAKIGGKFHTALNTPVFRRFWLWIMDDGRAWKYDWTIKVDPDCVFFPNRLRGMLINEYKPHGVAGKAVWLNNCQLGLHGPIEVFSKQALGAYKDSHGACDEVAEKHGQEDVYMRHCFMKLQVPKVDAFNLLLESEWACNERPSSSTNMPPCYDRQVSFHPFKSVTSFFNCYDRAVKMQWSTPLYFNSVPPGPNNAHHA